MFCILIKKSTPDFPEAHSENLTYHSYNQESNSLESGRSLFRRCSFLTMAFALSIVCTARVQATENSPQSIGSVTKLDPVTVVATRSAQSTFTVPSMVSIVNTANDPSLREAKNLQDMFKNEPSVSFSTSARRNGQVPIMRGYRGSAGIITLLDGTRQNFDSGHSGQFFIDPTMVHSVEVVRGASSALYGSDGMGGVLAFRTKSAGDLLKPGQRFGARAFTGYQSVNQEKMASASLYGRTSMVDILGSFTWRDSGNIKLGGHEGTLPSDDRLYSALTKVGWSLSDYSTLSVQFLGYKSQSIEPRNAQSGIFTSPAHRISNYTVRRTIQSSSTKVGYDYSNPSQAWLNLKIQGYVNTTQENSKTLENIEEQSLGDERGRQYKTTGFTVDNQTFIQKGQSIEHILSYGFEYYRDTQKDFYTLAKTYGPAANGHASYWGVYLQDEIRMKKTPIPGEISLIPAVRYDLFYTQGENRFSREHGEWSPKLALTYKPVPWFMVFSSYAHGFRMPRLSHLHLSGPHFRMPQGTNFFVPNPDLKPETNHTYEGGLGFDFAHVAQENDRLTFKGSYFHTDSRNFIDREVKMTMKPCCGTTRFINVPYGVLHGYDAEARYENKHFLGSLAYSYVTGKNKETGAYLVNTTPPMVTAHLGLKLPEWNSVAGWRTQWAGEYTKTKDPKGRRATYTVHDVYYEYTFPRENLLLSVGVDNIFNKRYETLYAGVVQPGRNVKVQLRYTW